MVTINTWGSADPAEVGKGGTGLEAVTVAYSVLCGGTTTTAPLQSVASVGTSGQQLTSNGAALPTFEAAGAGGGAWSFVSSQTISSDATIDFTGIETGYDYQYRYYELVTANDGVVLWMRVGTGATPTWIDGSNTYRNTQGGLGTKLLPHDFLLGTGTNEALMGYAMVYNPGDSSNFTRIFFSNSFIDSTGAQIQAGEGGVYQSATAVTAVRFMASTGNLATGIIREYRRALS